MILAMLLIRRESVAEDFRPLKMKRDFKTMQNYNNLKIIFGANMRRTKGHKKG